MLSSDQSDGYVTSIDYTYGAYREMAPAMIRFSLICNGIEPPRFDSSFNYCELGFGQGVGLNLLASSNSNGQFFGTDFNSSQAEHARRMSVEAGLSNINISDDSFQDYLDRSDLPEFDVVALHGIYSWVSPQNRELIGRFLRKRTKPGTVIYISYNCLPGWSPMAPMQWLMKASMDYNTAPSADAASRVKAALAMVERVAEQPTGYFKVHAAANEYLKKIKTQDTNYLAHEYLNQHWHPLHFMDVAAELGEGRAKFLCSADLSGQLDDMSLATETRALLAEVNEPMFRQQLRDYVLCTKFRRDLFGRGSSRLSSRRQEKLLRETPIHLVRPRAACGLDVTTSIGRGQLRKETYEPILNALSQRTMTIDELARHPDLSNRGFSVLVSAIAITVGAGYAQPGLPGAQDASATKRLNNLLIDDSTEMAPKPIAYLASPLLGSGQSVTMMGKVFMSALRDRDDNPEDVKARAAHCANYAFGMLKRQGRRVVHEGKQITGDAESLAILRENAEKWLVTDLPMLRSLGI